MQPNGVLNCEVGAFKALIQVTTQTPIEPRRPISAPPQGPKIHRVEVYWHAVTYKTVVIYSSLILVIGIADLPDGGVTLRQHITGFTAGQSNLAVFAFF